MRLPINAAKAAGHDVDFMSATPDEKPDVLILQRPMARVIVEQMITQAQAEGIKVVIEIDDLFANLPHNNPAFYTTHPRRDADNNRTWLQKACTAADWVTVTTQELANQYGRGKSSIIPNYVPVSNCDIENTHSGRVGYTGAVCWHVDDMAVINGKLNRDTPFISIGDVETTYHLPYEDCEFIGFQALLEYPKSIARMSVGIVPLADNAFNRGKSALKATEMASVGVFPIMSPLQPQIELHEKYGIGEIVTKPKHWNKTVQWWLTHDEERERRTKIARDIVRDELTIETQYPRWLAAWTKAFEA